MKKFRYGVLFLALVGIVLVSCKKEIEIELENKIILNQEGENKFNYNFDIISIEPISGDISKYEEKYNETIQLLGYNIDFNESKIVTYTNSDVIAIYTPIIDIENPSLKSDLLILESENELLDFELIITETSLNDSISRYLYSTLYGEFIVQFDVRLSDGLVLDVITAKSWADRFKNCVTWTFNNMSYLDYLACMAAGKFCAGGIASMCAVGASYGYFETSLNP